MKLGEENTWVEMGRMTGAEMLLSSSAGRVEQKFSN
jgi:hypothetical protein